MSPSSISADRISAFSSAEGGDPAAYVKALLGLTQEGVFDARRQSIGSAREVLADRARLLALQKILAPLTTMADGKGIVLGATLDASNDVKSSLAAVGVSLTTEASYYLTIDTFDSAGKTIAGTKHIATPTEKAAAEAATLPPAEKDGAKPTEQAATAAPTPTADDTGVEVRTSGTGNDRKVYTLYKKEEALTASTADLAAMRNAIEAGLLANTAAAEKTLALPGLLAIESQAFEERLLSALGKSEKAREVAKEVRQQDAETYDNKRLEDRHRDRERIDNTRTNRSDPANASAEKD